MSKIKLTGHASGSGVLTIAAPNTDSDRTITLPDVTGTLLDSGSDLPAANLTGTVADARISTLTASKLTGDLPAISGANLTGLSSFDPDGAVVFNESGADVDFRVESDTKVNAFTVNGATGRVGVNRGTDPDARLEVSAANETALAVTATVSGEYGVIVTSGSTNATPIIDLRNTNNASRLKVLADGRGLSQFTAKAWLTYNHENTPSILDSHNISSVTDRGTGLGTMNFANAMGNTNYCVVGSALDGGGENDNRHFNHSAGSTETTSAFDFFTGYVDISGVYEGRTVANDCARVSVQVFGD